MSTAMRTPTNARTPANGNGDGARRSSQHLQVPAIDHSGRAILASRSYPPDKLDSTVLPHAGGAALSRRPSDDTYERRHRRSTSDVVQVAARPTHTRGVSADTLPPQTTSTRTATNKLHHRVSQLSLNSTSSSGTRVCFSVPPHRPCHPCYDHEHAAGPDGEHIQYFFYGSSRPRHREWLPGQSLLKPQRGRDSPKIQRQSQPDILSRVFSKLQSSDKIPRPPTENMFAYLASAEVPRIRLTIARGFEWERRRDEAAWAAGKRALKIWAPLPRWSHDVVELVEDNVPSEPLDERPTKGDKAFCLPAPGFSTATYPAESVINDQTFLAWFSSTYLQTTSSILHLLRAGTLHLEWRGITTSTLEAVLEGHGSFLLSNSNKDKDHVMLLATHPASAYPGEVLRRFARVPSGTSWIELKERGLDQLANLLQQQTYDECHRHGVRYFIVTTLKYWVFGVFNATYSQCSVSHVLEHDSKLPTVMQAFTAWMLRAVDERANVVKPHKDERAATPPFMFDMDEVAPPPPPAQAEMWPYLPSPVREPVAERARREAWTDPPPPAVPPKPLHLPRSLPSKHRRESREIRKHPATAVASPIAPAHKPSREERPREPRHDPKKTGHIRDDKCSCSEREDERKIERRQKRERKAWEHERRAARKGHAAISPPAHHIAHHPFPPGVTHVPYGYETGYEVTYEVCTIPVLQAVYPHPGPPGYWYG